MLKRKKEMGGGGKTQAIGLETYGLSSDWCTF